jgi:hypothetical protein
MAKHKPRLVLAIMTHIRQGSEQLLVGARCESMPVYVHCIQLTIDLDLSVIWPF